MTTIVWPSNTTDIIDDIRDAIGRGVDFYTVASSTPCPVCNLDPVTNTSVDSFCPTCSGLYWIPVYAMCTITGHVTWGNMDIMRWETGGQYFDGDVRVQIKYTPQYLTIVDDAESSGFVVIDNKTMTIRSRILRGVKAINRILIDLIEKEK